LTDAFQKICTDEEVENKRCITCDETHDFYSVASRKLIHLFIYQNDLFQNINLRSECLLEDKIDVTELRRRVELMLRQEVSSWELSQEDKNKFVLCTICNIIRHLHLLSQLDKMDAINTFFKFREEIYNLSVVELTSEREQVMIDLDLGKPQVIGEKHPKEIVISHLPKQNEESNNESKSALSKEELVKEQLVALANAIDLGAIVPIKIIELKRKAKKLLDPTENKKLEQPDYSWVDVFLENTNDKQFLSFLAMEILEMESNQEQTNNSQTVTIDQLTFQPEKMSKAERNYFKSFAEKCSQCAEEITLIECGKRSELAEEIVERKNPGEIKEVWENQLNLRPCLAKELLEKIR